MLASTCLYSLYASFVSVLYFISCGPNCATVVLRSQSLYGSMACFLFDSIAERLVTKYCDEHVCVSVCLSARISPKPQARSLPNFSAHVACGRGSVLLRQADEIPRGEGAILGGFPPQSQCIVTRSLQKGISLSAGKG